jgi:hypothetical protein
MKSFVLCGACAAEAQEKLFKKVMPDGFSNRADSCRWDIRQTDNDGILSRMRERVDAILPRKDQRQRIQPT